MEIILEKQSFSQSELIKAIGTIDNSKCYNPIVGVDFRLIMSITVITSKGQKRKDFTLLSLNYPRIATRWKSLNKSYFIDLKTCEAKFCSDILIGIFTLKSILRSKLPPIHKSWIRINYWLILQSDYGTIFFMTPSQLAQEVIIQNPSILDSPSHKISALYQQNQVSKLKQNEQPNSRYANQKSNFSGPSQLQQQQEQTIREHSVKYLCVPPRPFVISLDLINSPVIKIDQQINTCLLTTKNV